MVSDLTAAGHDAAGHSRSTGVDLVPDMAYYRAKTLQAELLQLLESRPY